MNVGTEMFLEVYGGQSSLR